MKGHLVVCDRCQAAEQERDVHNLDGWREVLLPLDPQHMNVKTLHLCPRCVEGLIRFLGFDGVCEL